MTTPIPNIPAISTKATPAEIKRAFDALRAYFAQLQTVRASVASSAGGSGSGSTDGGGTLPDGGTDGTVDMSIPPVITGFTATGAFNSIILEWDAPNYSNHAYTEIHRAETDNLGVAVFIDTTPAAVYADTPPDSSLAVTYYYWVRNVSTSSVKGPFQATHGAQASTADDPAYLLEVLTNQITAGHLFQDLNDRINLIDMPGTGLVDTVGSHTGSIFSLTSSVNERAKVFAQAAAPTAMAVNDLWVETDNGNKLWRWNGSAWTSAQDTSKNRTFFQAATPTATATGDIWVDSDDNNRMYRWSGSAWADASDPRISANAASLLAINSWLEGTVFSPGGYASAMSTLTTSVGERSKVFGQATQPTATAVNDLWIETDNSNKLWRWNGSAWTSAQDAAKNRTFFQADTPTATATGDLWFDSDDDNRAYRWDGSSWADASDARTSANATSLLGIEAWLEGTPVSPGGYASAMSTMTTNVTTVQASAATDDAVAYGFNPTFSLWSGTVPDGWIEWSGGSASISKETEIKRVGQYAVKFTVPAGVNRGMSRRVDFKAAPLPVDTVLSGTVDVYLQDYVGPGMPGILVRLFFRDTAIHGDSGSYRDTYVTVPITTEGVWQRLPFTARLNTGEQIHEIMIYVMPSWSAFPGGQCEGVVVYDNLRFSLFTASMDAERRAADAQTAATAVANTAQATANTAVANAATAQGLLDDIASDGRFTPGEKSDARREWDIVAAEKAGINSQATTFSISTENTTYNTKFQNLANYLNNGVAWSAGIPSWINDASLSTTTNITGSIFRTTWKEYYDARTVLLNAIASKAKTLADTAQAAAAAAQTTANTAVSNAATAQSAANTANGLLADIANDDKLTASEKQQTKVEWDGIVAEKSGIDAQADIYSITTEKTAYGTAYTTLSTYITPLLASLTTPSDITGTAFRANFSAYYSARQTLLNKIVAAANAALFNTSFATHIDWRFRNTLSGWTVAAAGSLTPQANTLLVTNVTGNGYIMSPAIAVTGGQQTKVRARIRHIAGAGSWRGRLYWQTAGHGYTASYYSNTPNDNTLAGWHIVEWNLTTPTAGGTDWIDNVITGIRFDLTTGTAGEVWEIDWIAIGEYGFNSVSETTVAGIQAVTTASATSISQLQARLDTGDYAAVKTESSANANSIGDIEAKYSVKVDVNGYVSGFGLIATENDGVPTSEFGVLADKFWVCSPGVPTRIPFVVFNGITYMDVAMIRDATITNAKIADLSADKITAGYLNAARIDVGTIAATHLASNAVTAVKISANAVTAAKVAANAITATKIAAGSITTAHITAGNITTDTINGNAVTDVNGAYYVGPITAGTISSFVVTTIGNSVIICADVLLSTPGELSITTLQIKRGTTVLKSVAIGPLDLGLDEQSHTIWGDNSDYRTVYFVDTPPTGASTYSLVLVGNGDARDITFSTLSAKK